MIKKHHGRQLARVSVIPYHETVWSDVFPGNRHTVHCLEPAVLAAETALELSSNQRKRTVWRLDGGAGSDEHLRWLIQRGYHVMAKGMSHSRAEALSKQVTRWDAYGGIGLGEVDPPVDYGQPVRVFVKRRLKEGVFVHSYYVLTLSLPSKGLFIAQYDAAVGPKSNNSAATNPAWAWKHVASAVSWVKKGISCLLTWLTTCCPTSNIVLWLVRHSKALAPNGLSATCWPYQENSFLTVVTWFESSC